MLSDMSQVLSATVPRLLLAAVLGGVIGVERSWRRRPAGIRTNMFICFGAALFTTLSEQLALPGHQDPTRIAAQVITGIGFLGAGAILHERGSVSGLTTASTVFVVAAVGMAAGAGLYTTAIFATLLVLLALVVVGWLEVELNLRNLRTIYEVTGSSVEVISTEVNAILESDHKLMTEFAPAQTPEHWRMQFTVEGTHREQVRLLARLKQSSVFGNANAVGRRESE